jgi:hypothetical protein
MRRVLYVLIVLAMLAVPASSVFAVEPQAVEQLPGGEVYLGELLLLLEGGFLPFERVDAWLTRPKAVFPGGWPLATQPPVVGPTGNMWWWTGPASEQRRWSFAETEGTVFETADMFGVWGAILMLPRDEVWYPCSFPLKWKCNYYVEGEYFLHSPQTLNFLPSSTEIFPPALRYWPWEDLFGAAADPKDTISPLWIDIQNYGRPGPPPEGPIGVQYEVVVTGYDWKWSDVP